MTTVQFVDSIASSPTVRLNLNDGTVWRTVAEGTRLTPPPLRRAEAQTLLRDGAHIPADAYDNRLLQLRLALFNTTADAHATQIQNLARELDRPTNFLKWQPAGATHPVFFRTFRSDIAQIDRVINASSRWRDFIELELLAEPFAYGLKETLSAVTVNNDPAAGSNGMFFDVTGVKGDVETPLILTIARTAQFAGLLSSAYGVRRRGAPSQMPFVLQCESMTLATDTTLPGNDTAMSGSSSNYARVSFATVATLTNRLTAARFPSTGSVDVRGTYRVFLRHRQSGVGDVMAVRLTYGASDGLASNFFNDTVTVTSDTNRRWTDLGLVPFPAGADPVYDGYSGTELPVRGLSFSVQAQRVSGAGTLDLDALLFVPADDRFGTIGWRSEALGTDNFALDGAADAVYALEGTTEIRSMTGPITRTAGAPLVSPGVTNRVVWMLNAGPANQQDTIGDTTAITPSYYPRYLYVRPAST